MNHSRLMALLMGGASFVCFTPLSDAGGGGDGGEGGGGGGDPAAAAAAAAGGGAWAPPEGVTIPAEFMGTDANDTLSKLTSGYTALNTRAEGLRTELGKKGSAPAKPEDYTFTPSDKVAGYIRDPAKDPGLAAARAAAHKHGIPQAAFDGFINDTFGAMAESGALAAPFNPKAEITSYAAEHGLDQAGAVKSFTENEAFASGLASQLLNDVPEKLRSGVQAELNALTDTAAGQTLLRALSTRLAKSGIIPIAGNGGAVGAMTKAEAEAMGGDPRIDPVNENHPDMAKRFDPALRKKYDAYFGIKG